MNIVTLIISIYALSTLAAIVGIIYLVIRKQRVRKTEHFEKRNN